MGPELGSNDGWAVTIMAQGTLLGKLFIKMDRRTNMSKSKD